MTRSEIAQRPSLTLRCLPEDHGAAERLASILNNLESVFTDNDGRPGRISNIETRIVHADDGDSAPPSVVEPTLCLWSASVSDVRCPGQLLPNSDAESTQIHAALPGAVIVAPWSESQAGDLSWLQSVGQTKNQQSERLKRLAASDNSRGFWDLLRACYRVLGALSEMRYCLFLRNAERPHIETGERAKRLWRYSDLEEMVRRCAPEVADFAPDSLFSFDARGGQWAMSIKQVARINPPLYVGFRLKRDGLRRRDSSGNQSPLFDACSVIYSKRWELYIPPALSELPRNARILFIDDYSRTGDTSVLWRNYMTHQLGFAPDNLRTLTLFTTKETDLSQLPGHIYGWQSDARVNPLIYMHQR
ncbi:MAG: hypothetical protein AAF829_06455 [Pseudomonadota bacterium]